MTDQEVTVEVTAKEAAEPEVPKNEEQAFAFDRIILPYGADLLMWCVVYLLRTNPEHKKHCPLPTGAAVLHVPGDRHDWRVHLPGVTPSMDTVRKAEEGLQCLFVGVDDGTGMLHLREDVTGTVLPPRLLPNMQDVVDGIADDLTSSEKKLIALVQEPVAFMADPWIPTVDGSLAATVRRLEWLRVQGSKTEEEITNLICRLLTLAHHRIKAKAVMGIQDLAPAALHAWALACGRDGLSEVEDLLLKQAAVLWSQARVEADIDLICSQTTPMPLGAEGDAIQWTLVMGESRSPEFLATAFRTATGPCVVAQHNGDGRWLVATRDVNILPIVSALRERVAEEDVADSERPHLTDIGRPMVGGVRTPVFLDGKKRTCGNWSAQNPFLAPVWMTAQDMQRLITQALAPTP